MCVFVDTCSQSYITCMCIYIYICIWTYTPMYSMVYVYATVMCNMPSQIVSNIDRRLGPVVTGSATPNRFLSWDLHKGITFGKSIVDQRLGYFIGWSRCRYHISHNVGTDDLSECYLTTTESTHLSMSFCSWCSVATSVTKKASPQETGKISFKNLKRVAKELGERMTDEELQELRDALLDGWKREEIKVIAESPVMAQTIWSSMEVWEVYSH